MEIELKMRDMREDHGLTQWQVAEYLMCDQSFYSKIWTWGTGCTAEYHDSARTAL